MHICLSVTASDTITSDVKRSSSNINGAPEESENSCCGPTDAIRTCQKAMERQNGWRRLIHPLRSDTSQESSETLQYALAVQRYSFDEGLPQISVVDNRGRTLCSRPAGPPAELAGTLLGLMASQQNLTKPSGPWWVEMFCLSKRLSAPLNIEREVRQCGSMSPATFGPH